MNLWQAIVAFFSPCTSDACHDHDTDDLIQDLKKERARTDRQRKLIQSLPHEYSWEELMDRQRRNRP